MSNIFIGNFKDIDKNLLEEIEWSKKYGKGQVDYVINESTGSDFPKKYTMVYINEIYKKLLDILDGKNIIEDVNIVENKNGEKFVVIGKENGIICNLDFIKKDKTSDKIIFVELKFFKYYKELPDNLRQKMEKTLSNDSIKKEEINNLISEVGNYDIDGSFSIENIIEGNWFSSRFLKIKFHPSIEAKKDFFVVDIINILGANFQENLIDEIEYLKNIFKIKDILEPNFKNKSDEIYGSCNDLKKIYANRIALSLKNTYKNKKEDLNKLFSLFKENDMNDLNKRIIYNDLDERAYFLDTEQYTILVEDNVSHSYTQSHLNVFWKDKDGNYKTWDIYPCLMVNEEDYLEDTVIYLTEQYKKHGQNKTFKEILEDINNINIIKDRALSYNIKDGTVEIDFDNIKNCSNLQSLSDNITYMLKNAKKIFKNLDNQSKQQDGSFEIFENNSWDKFVVDKKMKI